MHYFFRISHNGFTELGQERIKIMGFCAAPVPEDRFVKMSRMSETMLDKFVHGEWDASAYACNTTHSVEEVLASIQSAAKPDDLIQFVVL